MPNSVSKEDISELKGYLKNINSFEKHQKISQKVLIMYVWGYLLIAAGLIDLYASLLVNYGPQGAVWIVIITIAFIIQQIILTQPFLTEYSEEYSPLPKLENNMVSIISTFVMFAITYLIGAAGYLEYIMIFVSLFLGIIGFIEIKFYNTETSSSPVNSYLLTGLILLGNVIIGNLISTNLYLLNGLIFGIINGGHLLIKAKNEKKILVSLF